VAQGAQSDGWIIPAHLVGKAWTITGKRLAGSDRSIGLSYTQDDSAAAGGGSFSYKPSHPVQIFKQSEATAARRRFWFTFYSSTGSRLTGLTGASLGGKISKNGATPASVAGSWTEVDSASFPGVYYYEATATELNTLGSVVVVAGPDGTFGTLQESHGTVIAADLFDGVRAGLTALPNAAANAAGGLMTAGTGTNQVSASGGNVNANITQWLGSAPNALVSGRVDSSTGAMAAGVVTSTAIAANAIGASQIASNAITSAKIAAGAITSSQIAANAIGASQIAAAALTAAKFGTDVNIQVARTGTAQAGSTSTTIKLDAGASAVDNQYNELICYIVSGTGAGQSRTVIGYVGSTKVAMVDAAWATIPDATSVFQLLPTAGGVSGTVNANVISWKGTTPNDLTAAGNVQVDAEEWKGTSISTPAVSGIPKVDLQRWQGNPPNTLASGRVDVTVGEMQTGAITAGSIQDAAIDRASFAQDALDLFGDIRRNTAQSGSTSTTIKLDATAAGANDRYKNGLVLLVGGTGVGQWRTITAYDGTTKVATVDRAWDITPDNTTVYAILAAGSSVDSTSVANAVWDEPRSNHTSGGSYGEGVNVVSIATAAAQTIRDSILTYAFRTGRTIKGALRRLDAFVTNKATGLSADGTVTFFQPDGSTVEFTQTQDTATGVRGTPTVTNSES
jgi:hypothetical protein